MATNKLEDTIKCVWRQMSNNRLSTTFEAVKELDLDHPLWKCKYNCNGYDFVCDGYKSTSKIIKYIKNERKIR